MNENQEVKEVKDEVLQEEIPVVKVKKTKADKPGFGKSKVGITKKVKKLSKKNRKIQKESRKKNRGK